jgi:hypothetical protein
MKQLIVLLIVTLLSTATFAQKHRGNDLILSHATELNLTADQSAKLNELSKDHRAAMQALKQNESLAVAEKEEQMHLVHKQYREACTALLTEEQLKKLKTIVEDSSSVKGKNMDTKDLKENLNLTDEQTVKLKQMQEENQAEMMKIQQDSSVTEANKKFRLEELKKERRKELESILTPDQQRKYKEMRNRKPKNDVKQ